jgi:hypothetical protein
VERFAYFMVRIRRPDELPDNSFSGLVEQLATGEIRIVRSWPDAQRKISWELHEGNEAGSQ